ncbi:sel1 repeat family protein [Streptomyces cyaneus]|uniref:sel1 repeat family protein n=1 Tax=Streptomyces cyaneus TaxID=1904 RepID=UPI000FF88498|nr:sel1 repeat family protein [Streptomyces cyaneus]
MATELEELRDALLRAMLDSRDASQRVLKPLMRSSIAGAADLWIRTAGIASTDSADAHDWVRLLAILRRNHPREFSDLKAIAADHAAPLPPPTSTASGVTAGGPRSVAAGGDIGLAVTGDNTRSRYVAGDHIDFRDSTFHDRVVGVQHNHYGTVPAPAELRPVGDVGPREFGVRPTRPVPGLPDVPPYVPRDCDENLRAQLAGSSLVLILGEPCVGKSYTAWHGVRSLEGHRLYAPDPGEDLRPLAAALQSNPGKSVVWLDELTGHLGAGRLDLRLLGRLSDLGAVVLATMSFADYYRRRTGTTPGDRVIAAARTVELAREWTEAELARLAPLDDPRAYPAYVWSGREGVASYFAVGHHLYDEWRRVGTRLEHPRGQLLVRAAVDLARCGVTGAVPAGLLGRVQEQYRAEDRESFEDALAWATAPMFGVSGLLVAGEEDGTWRAYGALVAEALRSGDLEPVPDGVWWTLLDAAREPDSSLDFPAVLDAARNALHDRVEAGDTEVALGFARRTEGDEREVWLRQAADAGDPWAAVELAEIRRDRGEEADALSYLERAAEAGSARAAARLGSLLRDRAEHWLRTAAEAGEAGAAHDLAQLVGSTPGRGNEAMRWHLKAYARGKTSAAVAIAKLLHAAGSEEEAEAWYRRAVDEGDVQGVCDLGALLFHKGADHDTEAESLLHRAAMAGHVQAPTMLGMLKERQGDTDAALALYGEGEKRGDPAAEYFRAACSGEPLTSEWLRRAEEQGYYWAYKMRMAIERDSSARPDTVKE